MFTERVQVFIRGKNGIFRLSEIRNNPELWDKICSLKITDTYKLLKLNQQMDLIKAELQKLTFKGLLTTSEIQKARKKELGKRLTELEDEYYLLVIDPENKLPNEETPV